MYVTYGECNYDGLLYQEKLNSDAKVARSKSN